MLTSIVKVRLGVQESQRAALPFEDSSLFSFVTSRICLGIRRMNIITATRGHQFRVPNVLLRINNFESRCTENVTIPNVSFVGLWGFSYCTVVRDR